MLGHDLVDELRLTLYPLTLGSGLGRPVSLEGHRFPLRLVHLSG
jgi:riboflavin biosynthesis pyrimidine reductase